MLLFQLHSLLSAYTSVPKKGKNITQYWWGIYCELPKLSSEDVAGNISAIIFILNPYRAHL